MQLTAKDTQHLIPCEYKTDLDGLVAYLEWLIFLKHCNNNEEEIFNEKS